MKKKVIENIWLERLIGILALCSLCLVVGVHELDRSTQLYQCNLKAFIYLMIAANQVSGRLSFLVHSGAASLLPMAVQLFLMNAKENYISDEDL